MYIPEEALFQGGFSRTIHFCITSGGLLTTVLLRTKQPVVNILVWKWGLFSDTKEKFRHD
jgi:hypothetical protein